MARYLPERRRRRAAAAPSWSETWIIRFISATPSGGSRRPCREPHVEAHPRHLARVAHRSVAQVAAVEDQHLAVANRDRPVVLGAVARFEPQGRRPVDVGEGHPEVDLVDALGHADVVMERAHARRADEVHAQLGVAGVRDPAPTQGASTRSASRGRASRSRRRPAGSPSAARRRCCRWRRAAWDRRDGRGARGRSGAVGRGAAPGKRRGRGHRRTGSARCRTRGSSMSATGSGRRARTSSPRSMSGPAP